MRHFLGALYRKDTLAFKEELRTAEVLIIDDLQHICRSTATASEFLYTVNAFADLRRRVVIAADRAPTIATTIQARISHLRAAVNPVSRKASSAGPALALVSPSVPTSAPACAPIAHALVGSIRSGGGAGLPGYCDWVCAPTGGGGIICGCPSGMTRTQAPSSSIAAITPARRGHRRFETRVAKNFWVKT